MEIRSINDYKMWLSENREWLHQQAVELKDIPKDWLEDWEYEDVTKTTQ